MKIVHYSTLPHSTILHSIPLLSTPCISVLLHLGQFFTLPTNIVSHGVLRHCFPAFPSHFPFTLFPSPFLPLTPHSPFLPLPSPFPSFLSLILPSPLPLPGQTTFLILPFIYLVPPPPHFCKKSLISSLINRLGYVRYGKVRLDWYIRLGMYICMCVCIYVCMYVVDSNGNSNECVNFNLTTHLS